MSSKYVIRNFLVLFSLVFCSQVQAQVTNETIAQKLQATITSKIAGYQIKGQEVTITFPNDETFTLTAGYSTSAAVPIDSTKMWHWGSSTKPLTGFIVLQLIEEGKLNLSDSIGNFFDTDTLPNVSGTITIQELLRHTSGLEEIWKESVNPTLWQAVWGNRDSVWYPYQLLKYMPLPTSSRGVHYYTNTSSYMLSFIIEKVTGKSLETNFQDRIFTPLGMNNSYLSTGKSFNMSELNGVWTGNDNRSTLSHNSYLSSRSGNSALISTSADVAKFYRRYYQNLLLSEATMDSVRVPAKNSRKDFGNINGIRYIQTYGYQTEMLDMILSSGDTLRVQGHGGNGLGGAISIHWDKENVTLIMVQNDFSETVGFNHVKLLSDLMTILVADLPQVSTDIDTEGTEIGTIKSFELMSPYPNPFNPTVQIGFTIPQQGTVNITVYDMTGRQIAVLVDGWKTGGVHQVDWNAADQTSGVYLVRMEAGGYTYSKKLTLLK